MLPRRLGARFGVVIGDRAVALGTLRCRFAEPARKLLPSRWPVRPALQKFHGPPAP